MSCWSVNSFDLALEKLHSRWSAHAIFPRKIERINRPTRHVFLQNFKAILYFWHAISRLRCFVRSYVKMSYPILNQAQVHYITDVNPALVQVIIAMAWCWHPHGWHMWNTVIRLSCIFNTFAAVGLATRGARASATMELPLITGIFITYQKMGLLIQIEWQIYAAW